MKEPYSTTDSQSMQKPIMASLWIRLRALFLNQKALCTVPIWVLVIVSSLDNADKQLLASSFSVLEKALNLDVQMLGFFSLFTNLSYALSLPFWGFMVHRYGMARIHILLAAACASWGLTTCGMAAMGGSIVAQAIFRCANGFALGSILPLSQTLLVELVDGSMRGRAFGLMGLCERLAGTVAAASIVYYEETWQRPYYALGIFSILVGVLALDALHPFKRKTPYQQHHERMSINNNDIESSTSAPISKLTIMQIVRRIVQIPAFVFLVLQGIVGGTPWDIMSFLLLLMDWRGFTKEQIVSIQFTSGLSATFGGWLGGMLGDYAANHLGGTPGRISVAFASVAGGIPLYGLYIYAQSYTSALVWSNLFHVWATWTTSGAIRPICADLARDSSERAQIVALWIVLEKASGAIFVSGCYFYVFDLLLRLCWFFSLRVFLQ